MIRPKASLLELILTRLAGIANDRFSAVCALMAAVLVSRVFQLATRNSGRESLLAAIAELILVKSCFTIEEQKHPIKLAKNSLGACSTL